MLLTSLLPILALATPGLGAKLEQVTNFGGNPTKINMYIYVPDKLASKPAVIVAVRIISIELQASNLTCDSSTPAEEQDPSGTAAPSSPPTPTKTALSSSIPALRT